MQRLHPFPAPGPLQANSGALPALTVVDEDFCLPVTPRIMAAAVAAPELRAMPSPAPRRVTAKALNDEDDPFEDEFYASSRNELDFGPKNLSLPRFVPLRPEIFTTGRDPWAVNSIADLFRLYLPELSLSAGLVTFSGLLAGQMTHHFIHSIEASWVLITYLTLYLVHLSSLYLDAKGKPSMQSKGGFRTMLLSCFLLCIPHFVASAILKAAG